MSSTAPLKLSTQTITFQRPLKDKPSTSLAISNTQSHPVVFKIKVTDPKHFNAKPNMGRLEPGETIEADFTALFDEEPPINEKCKDKFLIQSTPLHPLNVHLSNPSIFERAVKEDITEQKFKAAYSERGPRAPAGHPSPSPSPTKHKQKKKHSVVSGTSGLVVDSQRTTGASLHDAMNQAGGGNEWLDSVEGEIAFFRSLMRSRPVGMHRHFHAMSMRTAIHHYTGRSVSMDAIWNKLRSLYDLDALELLDSDGYETPESGGTPVAIPSPSSDKNLSGHPFFRNEFELPYDAYIESELASRRARLSPSPEPPPPPAIAPGPRGVKRPGASTRGKTTTGDSDGSELTLESADEDAMTPKSAGTTEQGTADDADDPSAPPSKRGRGRSAGKRGGPGRGRGGRGAKKARTQQKR
ncbi:hypothetical protein K488DRAFT_82063 [Vararia minispora EC-137]|uniref:Uncharacterized protein n=1 Tax=Vararia minispora EC-137 TaxID=1314806 RepID=A0ACB8QX15_9AGAM|nr:hypothetical protein K488DRAFT_82063 [Vararia minispora EC-137]